MRLFRPRALLIGVFALLALPTTQAAERVRVVTSFSILADMIDNVGGKHVDVTALVGPNSDAHAYSPRPTDARQLAEADLVVFNGLQFEGWMERLIDASDFAGPLVVATDGSEVGNGPMDPHAWQDLGLGEVYVSNIRDGLIAADPDNSKTYRANAERYRDAVAATDTELRELLGEIPGGTSVITGHDAFGHFASAYGLTFLSPMGVSTSAEPSAADMGRLVDVIREQNVRALFHENMASPAIIDQLAEETGLPVAGTLYADALASEGEASTWLGMMRHNARVLHEALAGPDRYDPEH